MQNDFIPEKEYIKIVSQLPIFCVDFLIRCKDKNLLLKRTQEPVKGVYWVIGGRMRHTETLDQLAFRIQNREIGRHINNRKLIGFSNYLFPKVEGHRATHTPSLLYLVSVNEIFEPKIDDTHLDFIWSEKLPEELVKHTEFIDEFIEKK